MDEETRERLLSAIRTYSKMNPSYSLGRIVFNVCGLASPEKVSNNFFIGWLDAAIINGQDSKSP